MDKKYFVLLILLSLTATGCSMVPPKNLEIEPFGRGPYAVSSTNIEIAREYSDIGDDAMHEYLLGRAGEPNNRKFLPDILKHPESAWLTNAKVPNKPALYGPASGQILPVVTVLTFPSVETAQNNSYTFPYQNAKYGVFENMLVAGEKPRLADATKRYPLIIFSHGSQSHGIYEVSHAQQLASHGYIVAVINYGDERTAYIDKLNPHVSFLRPFLTKTVLDSLLESETFGANIDTENIGIIGHSFGGFTALAIAGGPFQENDDTVYDERIKAAFVVGPWVGGHYDGQDVFAFGKNNKHMNRITIPTICLFGTKDEATLPSFILPAIKQLSGPTYVVEMIDQPHIFEKRSWDDSRNWELLFFSAYLKDDPTSLARLKMARSTTGGNENIQLFEYQKPTLR